MSEEKKEEQELGKCFARKKRECMILLDRSVPRDCYGCKFAKPKQNETDGKIYPYVPR